MRVPFQTTATFIGKITDIDGEEFWCTEVRETGHGFYLWFGWPEHQRLGGAKAVLTQEVADHLRKHNFSWKAARMPVSSGVLNRFRQQMGVKRGKIDGRKKLTGKTVKDLDGRRFNVARTFKTGLDVPVHYGQEIGAEHPVHQFVLTPPLAALIKEWNGLPVTLTRVMPFDMATLRKFRIRLGLDYFGDKHDWWADRLHDLLALYPYEFVAKHGGSIGFVTARKTSIRLVVRMLQNPKEHAETLENIKIEDKVPSRQIAKTLGQDYNKIRRYRHAYRTLEAAGALDKIDHIDTTPHRRIKPDPEYLKRLFQGEGAIP